MQIAYIILYVLYLPDQQLPQIRPTFPPIFLAITRCAAIKRTSLPAVNLINGVIDVSSHHVPVMDTKRVRANDPCPPTIVRIPRINRREQISATKDNRWSMYWRKRSKSTNFLHQNHSRDRSIGRLLFPRDMKSRSLSTWKSLSRFFVIIKYF